MSEYLPMEERIIAVVKNAEIIFLNIVKVLIDLIHGNILIFNLGNNENGARLYLFINEGKKMV